MPPPKGLKNIFAQIILKLIFQWNFDTKTGRIPQKNVLIVEKELEFCYCKELEKEPTDDEFQDKVKNVSLNRANG